ncbi:MAG: PspC domain-containing protein [Saprospiraceae bacterium]|jgi:phage shock protein PspC (stress-responsive transcriptional regulator)|nr:PspC domain-containing protein [Saprospiraceae bacterium]
MNKIININLGKFPFIIDTDAFDVLDDYLAELKAYFSKSEGSEEIMQDIESRIAEILNKKMDSGKIISKFMVDEVIQTLGTPDMFDMNANGENNYYSSQQGKQSKKTDAKWGIKPGKKLFRHPEDKRVAGVCGGIAAYLGVEDSLWVRIAFAFGVIAGGSTVLLYLLFWIAVPVAKTASDRLSMTGEQINIDTIARKVDEGFTSMSEKIDRWKSNKK